MKGIESSNKDEMTGGSELHRQHGHTVLISGFTRALGLIALLVALILLAAYCTNQIV